jgi:dihydroxyacetone kinase
MGFALTSCTVPAKGTPTFTLGEDEMEFGVGIHGEPGVVREKLVGADELAAKLLERIVPDLPFDSGCEVALMINGFGATPLQELYVLNNSVAKNLVARGISVYRTFVGNYMTSIDMAGASVSLLKLDAELKKLLDAPVDAPAMKI